MLLRYRYAVEDEILLITGFPLYVELGNKGLHGRGKYSDMDMWGAAGVGHGPDSPKMVPAILGAVVMTMTLKTLVKRGLAAVPGVVIAPIGIALPDLYAHALQRPAVHIQQPPGQFGDPALCQAASPHYPGQIIVVIQRQACRIKRTGRLSGGWQQ